MIPEGSKLSGSSSFCGLTEMKREQNGRERKKEEEKKARGQRDP